MSRKKEPTGRNWVTLLIGSTFLIPGLAISAWSMYSYMRQATDAPVILCAGASAAFDGIGLFAGSKAHAFASAGRKAKFAWLIVWLSVAASILINWQHASTQHWNQGIHVLISAPAAAAAAAFELIMQETRETERAQHEKRVRTRQSVKIDADIWIHHPFMVWAERRRESAQRLREAIAAGRPSATADSGHAAPDTADTTAGQIPGQRTADAGHDGRTTDATADTDSSADTGAGSSAVLSFPDTRTGGQADQPAPIVTDSPRMSEADSADNAGELRELVSATLDDPSTRLLSDPGNRGKDISTLITDGQYRAIRGQQWDDLIERMNDPDAPNPSVTDVVRHVYRDEWDTGTIRAVVSEVLPDARPDTISRALRRVRTERTGRTDSADDLSGAYL